MPDRVLVAESEIQARQRVLSEDHDGTLEECRGEEPSLPASHPRGLEMPETVRCPYCVSGLEFRPMVAHVDGRYYLLQVRTYSISARCGLRM
jgi:hypothetical protein